LWISECPSANANTRALVVVTGRQIRKRCLAGLDSPHIHAEKAVVNAVRVFINQDPGLAGAWPHEIRHLEILPEFGPADHVQPPSFIPIQEFMELLRTRWIDWPRYGPEVGVTSTTSAGQRKIFVEFPQ